MRVFVDSDVVISSLLSSRGAAFLLLNTPQITPVISSASHAELRIVTSRLHIDTKLFEALVKKRCEIYPLSHDSSHWKNSYKQYVTDQNDAHIVAGAHKSGTAYLISYNIKHFIIPTIKTDLNIIVMTPALFLQYLRSR